MKQKKMGFLGVGNYYSFDGGMGHFDLEIKSIKIRNNKVNLKGQRNDSHIDFQLLLYTIFSAENDTIENRLLIRDEMISRHDIHILRKKELNGGFKIKTKLEQNERIYFQSEGYGMIELKTTQ
jgi:hypothetical protein